MLKLCLAGCISILIGLPATAAISDDEISMKWLFICSSTYEDTKNLVYEKDKKNRDQIEAAFIKELEKKYSKNDVGLMLGKVVIETSGMGIDKTKFDPVDLCRNMLGSLKRQKEKTGTYLSLD